MKSETGEFGTADAGHQWDEAEDEQQKMLEPKCKAGTRASCWVWNLTLARSLRVSE